MYSNAKKRQQPQCDGLPDTVQDETHAIGKTGVMENAAQHRRCIVTHKVSIAYPEKNDQQCCDHRTEQVGSLAAGKATTERSACSLAPKDEGIEQLPGGGNPEKGKDDEQNDLNTIEIKALKGHDCS